MTQTTPSTPSKAERRRQREAEAARVLAEQESARRRRRLLSIGGVVLAVLLLVAAAIGVQQLLAEEPTAVASEHSLAIGDPDAPHRVIVYEDFLCPYCGQLEAASKDGLARAAEEGKVYVEYRPYELLDRFGDYSANATATFAVVLQTAGPEVAKEYHDLLFEEQPAEAGPFPNIDQLVDLAVEAGADEDEVRQGIEDGSGEEWTAAATRAARDAGITGTPTVLLDGEVFLDGRTVEEMAANLVAAVD